MDIPHRRADAGVAHDFLYVFRACAAFRRARAERVTPRAVKGNVRDASILQGFPPPLLDVRDGLAGLWVLKQVAV